MRTNGKIEEIYKVINGEHKDPFSVLGMHVITEGKKKCVTVRAYLPFAKSCYLIDLDNNEKLEMDLIDDSGFFEIILKDRKEIFKYNISSESKKIADFITENYPLVNFYIWDFTVFNEFVNHMIGHNHIFLEIEKDGCGFVYDSLKENFPNVILFQPDAKEIERYSVDNDIYIQKAISEAPAGIDNKYELSLEKLIVDMFANKTLQQLISKGDYPQALEEMFSKYQISERKLFRYATRRNKKEEIIKFIKEKTNIEIQTI